MKKSESEILCKFLCVASYFPKVKPVFNSQSTMKNTAKRTAREQSVMKAKSAKVQPLGEPSPLLAA